MHRIPDPMPSKNRKPRAAGHLFPTGSMGDPYVLIQGPNL